MDVQSLIFGNGRTAADLRGTFTPKGSPTQLKLSDLLATYRGPGKERVLDKLERAHLIGVDQRLAGGAASAAEQGVAEFAQQAVAPLTVPGRAGVPDNPIYQGLYGQMFMREHGIQVVDRVGAPVAAAAQVADGAGQQSIVEGLQRLVKLPAEQQVPALVRAVDATAAAGLGDDSFTLLADAITTRPVADTASALHTAIDEVATIASEAGGIVHRATPAAGEALAGIGRLHPLPGAMSMSEGIKDTLRLLSRVHI